MTARVGARARAQEIDAEASEVLSIQYRLSELPTSQHRAGLAGLVLMCERLERVGRKEGCICRIVKLSAREATFEVDHAGLRALYDELYAASNEERAENQIRKNQKSKAEIPPLRVEEREEPDPRSNKIKKKKVYIYESVIPKAALVAELAPGGDAGAPWVKIWRDMVWGILRGVPATRASYEARARGEPTTDADDMWRQLSDPKDRAVELPSTYFLGAMAVNAENVSFRDRPRFQFLLHFWPYVAQVYQPANVDEDGKHEFVGYALAVPDVSDLAAFCEELPFAMRNRQNQMLGYRPREAVVDLAAESALDFFRRLGERIASREQARTTSDLVLAVDVFHVEKEGNNVRLRGAARVVPEEGMIREYERVKRGCQDHLFRRQRMRNVLAGNQWHRGFEQLFATLPYERTIGSRRFASDAHTAFTQEKEMSDENAPPDVERLLYEFVRGYVLSRMDGKYQMRWESVKDDPSRRAEFNEKKAKIAKDAFLAIRSRTGADFISYFAGTLGSVPHRLNEEGYTSIALALREKPEYVRTLTLLALSANS